MKNLQEAADKILPGLTILISEKNNQEENNNTQNVESTADAIRNNIPVIIGCLFVGLLFIVMIVVVVLYLVHRRR